MTYSRRQLEYFGEPLGESVTQQKPGGRIYGGGGSSTPTSQTVTQQMYAKEFSPYAKEIMDRAMTLSSMPYTPYGGERLAGFDPLQLEAQQRTANMTTAPQLDAATQMAGLAGLRAGNLSYNPQQYQNQYQAPGSYQTGYFSAPNLQQYQMNQVAPISGLSRAVAPEMGASRTSWAPELQQYSMGPAERVSGMTQQAAPQIMGARTAYRPDLQQYQMGQAERIGTESFVQPGTADAYMSPYMQQVVSRQQEEAERQSERIRQQNLAQTARAGVRGTSGQALIEAERQKNLSRQLGDIQATGSQAAYQQAQQQFNAEQQARLAAAQANQQAGLTVGQQNLAAQLGVQQLGTQTGLQTALANLTNEQQAAVQNQAAILQTQGLNANQALQAALANQQAGLTVGQQNLAAQLGTQQLGTQSSLQAALANLSNEQQAAVQNQAAKLQTQGLNANQALQAALANQQTSLATGQTNLQALLGIQQLGSSNAMDLQRMLEQSRQYGYGQDMTSAQLAAQYGLSAQQLSENAAQFGANLGLQGIQQQLAAAGLLGNIGQTQFGQNSSIINALNIAGQQRQTLAQQQAEIDYQNFLRQQQYPYQQTAWATELLKSAPQQTTQSIYAAPSSPYAQTIGTLGTLYGASQMAKGGLTSLVAHKLMQG